MCASYNPLGAHNGALAPPIADKLIKILGMLGSDHDGERAAAGLKAHRLLHDHGGSWEALVRPQPVVIRIPSPSPQHSYQRPQPGWRADVVACRSRPDLLSQWEREFLDGLGERRSLTEKQAAILARLVQRVRS